MPVYRHLQRCLGAALLLIMLVGCAAAPPILPDYRPAEASTVKLEQVPFYAQERYQCGPAALAMSLGASGIDVQPDVLVPKVWVPALKGSLQAEMIATARRYGRVPYVIEPRLAALLAELDANHPVLVLLNLGWNFYPIWHYAVVIGYQPEQDKLILHSGTIENQILDTRAFLDDWDKAENWGLVLLAPGSLPAAGDAHRYLDAVAGLEQVQPQAAEPAYAAATRRWPEAEAAWLGLGNTRYAQNDFNGAANAWRALLKRQPQAAVARNNLAQLLAEQGCRNKALAAIDTALTHASAELQAHLRTTRANILALPEPAQACPAELL